MFYPTSTQLFFILFAFTSSFVGTPDAETLHVQNCGNVLQTSAAACSSAVWGGKQQHMEVDNDFSAGILIWIIVSTMLVQISHHLFVLCLQRYRNVHYARFKSH